MDEMAIDEDDAGAIVASFDDMGIPNFLIQRTWLIHGGIPNPILPHCKRSFSCVANALAKIQPNAKLIRFVAIWFVSAVLSQFRSREPVRGQPRSE